MTREEVKDLVKEALIESAPAIVRAETSRVISETLQGLGINIKDTERWQKNMAQLDFWRRCFEAMAMKAALAIVWIFVTGIVSAVIIGFKDELGIWRK